MGLGCPTEAGTAVVRSPPVSASPHCDHLWFLPVRVVGVLVGKGLLGRGLDKGEAVCLGW